MKQLFFYFMVFSLLLIACDTNDNNDPATPCEAHFYTVAATAWDAAGSTYEVYRYQKSDILSSADVLFTGNPFSILGGNFLTRANLSYFSFSNSPIPIICRGRSIPFSCNILNLTRWLCTHV